MLVLTWNYAFLHAFLYNETCLEHLLLDYIPSIYNKIEKMIV